MAAQRWSKSRTLVTVVAILLLWVALKVLPDALAGTLALAVLGPLLLYAAWHHWFGGGRAARLMVKKTRAEIAEARPGWAAARGWHYNGAPSGLAQYEYSGVTGGAGSGHTAVPVVRWRLWFEVRTDRSNDGDTSENQGAVGIFRQTYEPPLCSGLVFAAEVTAQKNDEWVIVSVPSPNREYLRQALSEGYQQRPNNTQFWANWPSLHHGWTQPFCSHALLLPTESELFDRHCTLFARDARWATLVTPELATLLVDYDAQSRTNAKDAGYRYQNFNARQRERELCVQLTCPDPTHEQIERLALLGIALAERSRWMMVNRAV